MIGDLNPAKESKNFLGVKNLTLSKLPMLQRLVIGTKAFDFVRRISLSRMNRNRNDIVELPMLSSFYVGKNAMTMDNGYILKKRREKLKYRNSLEFESKLHRFVLSRCAKAGYYFHFE